MTTSLSPHHLTGLPRLRARAEMLPRAGYLKRRWNATYPLRTIAVGPLGELREREWGRGARANVRGRAQQGGPVIRSDLRAA